ncbi:MAG: toll/interleukin-1 receptor domain-containing protein, partial [Actinomycetota bacterium]|nr:toll/interleukin-1 receptor domain-containing protein [Actinomycetota bacterium]
MADRGDVPQPPKVFISYRREESEGHAGRLYDALSRRFGSQHVFLDVSTIQAGREFDQAIEQAITSCDVVLAVIGRSWLSVTDAEGRRRLDDPKDWVRLELEVALASGTRVIPVLFQDAKMPQESDLPESLRPLLRRQALQMTSSRWTYDLERLVAAIEEAAT